MAEISIAADPLYQHLLLTAEKKFWRCVARGATSFVWGGTTSAADRGGASRRYGGIELVGAVRGGVPLNPIRIQRARKSQGRAQRAAKEAFGHGIRAKRSKSGAVSFEMMDPEASDAPLQ
jgi:hypothetical protein